MVKERIDLNKTNKHSIGFQIYNCQSNYNNESSCYYEKRCIEH